jgi:hypothetical protein
MDWIVSNYEGILLVVTTVIASASAIAALTPTKKDDAFIARIINILALNPDRVKK